ncbi:beta-ketoacyl synthase N-terminal-like domain-containing protein [Caballeronia sp. TF1N1]|uniref:beta-ketoacyl synthase N-terminal-like domain-containing protein n=1 Tax=Caballeronia sp. TF1N1 TaxID=2878153 RepID=UPI001FD1BDB2|nr:beta-ketoacyl synthase N-terminal-like domain-containing protein [Caballeronia sp. TF1N1]
MSRGAPAGAEDADIVLVGVGAATPLGRTAEASVAAARAGIAGFNAHPYMIDSRGDPFVAAMAPYLEASLGCDARMARLVATAARDAVRSLPDTIREAAHLAVLIGLPEPRPGVGATLADDLSASVTHALLAEGWRGPWVKTLPRGNAAGLMALEIACAALRTGRATFVLAGGADSHIEADTLEWLDASERLHVPINGWGYIPGEAAGFCLLCTADTARAHGLATLGVLGPTANAIEPNRIYTETVCIGEGLTKCVQRALAGLPADARIDDTICDQNGEAYRADEFGFMLARTSQRFADPGDFQAPADCWGDVGAASGPLFVALAAFAARKGYAKGPRTLLWASSIGGDRSAVVFSAPVSPDGER